MPGTEKTGEKPEKRFAKTALAFKKELSALKKKAEAQLPAGKGAAEAAAVRPGLPENNGGNAAAVKKKPGLSKPAKTAKKSLPKVKRKKDPEVKKAKEKVHFIRAAANRAFRQNPVLTRILAVSTVLGATVALKNGLLLSMAFVATGLPLFLLMFLISRKLPSKLAYPVAVLLSAALFTPVYMAAGRYFPEVTKAIGLYLPLTALNAVLLMDLHTVRGKTAGFLKPFAAAIGDLIGYSLILIVVSAVREILGSGTLYGRVFQAGFSFRFVLLPPGAFLLLGFMLAIDQAVKAHRASGKAEGSERR